MSAVSLLGPVPGVTPEREVDRGATGGSVAQFASVLSDQDLRLCESHFRLREEDASRAPSDSDSEGSTPVGADTTGALLLQLAAQRGSSADAVTTPPVGASTPADEAMTVPESSEADGGDLPASSVPVIPLSPTDSAMTDPTMTEPTMTEPTMTGTAGAAAPTGVAATGASTSTSTPTMIGIPTTAGTPATTNAGDVGTPQAASGSDTAVRPAGSRGTDETAVTPAGSSRVSAEATMSSTAPATVAPSASVTAPDTASTSAALASTSAAVDDTVDATPNAAASPGASAAVDDAPAIAVERAQPSASATPTAATAPAPVPSTAPLAAPDAADASTRAVAAQVSPVVVSIAQRPAGTHHLTLTVNPDNLGPVTLRAHISAAGDVQVELSGATEIGREALRTMLVDLRRDLAGVMPHATLSMGVGTGAEPPSDRGGQPGAGGTAGDPSASESDGRPRQHPESDPGRTSPGVIPTTTIAAGAGLDIFA
ncbi:flagellar hook-length control protein FliK [Microbacterium sp. Root553]|uniref:flagellar hook-length control protein FliK n=1 Tax=Microbacterium sp. Root553 TaxID=1736556 RepID=UPI00070189A0|nr:flagellar hook-length control protein FliK [Microbacterium sp. Root553]KQZ25049.1 hypothetical protein ASD43_12345 [Microbacterium sp. Root553]